VRRELNGLSQFASAERIVSAIPELGIGGVNLADVADAHLLADVQFAVLRGEFGVAENAAVWVTDDQLPHRAIYFLCEHLALVIAAGDMVHNMHQAYQRLPQQAAGFGTFLAGPSKTADIEQSLVIGAHGPKSLTVFVVG
jgi:L-lactate dehydrogenase complex protein LldG